VHRALAVMMTALTVVASLPSPAIAQDKPAMVPLKIDLIISRQAGDKKVSSMPYTLWVTANNERNRSTSLRMGVQVPVATTRVKEGEAPVAAYSYRNVGTNIDSTATSAADGRYLLNISLTDSGLQLGSKENQMPGVPAIREFQSQFSIMLKDGQSATYTSATDPVTGETLKVDVTLNVLK
jgi:type II secretory pathway component GspD/PulD (secretin)